MSTLQAIALSRIAKIDCTGKDSLREKEIVRRAEIAIVVREVLKRLEIRLNHAGIRHNFKAENSWTGSIYLKIIVLAPSGQRLKNCGAAIRISDHPEKDGFNEGTCQRTRFSRPIQRYFGIDSDCTVGEIDRKIEMIVGGIVKRYADVSESNFQLAGMTEEGGGQWS